MGVSTNCYTVYGVKVDYDNALTDLMFGGKDFEAFEKMVIADGMSGEYIVIGAILADSGDAYSDSMEGFHEINISDLPMKKAEVCAKFTELAPTYAHLLDGHWKLMAFVHYH